MTLESISEDLRNQLKVAKARVRARTFIARVKAASGFALKIPDEDLEGLDEGQVKEYMELVKAKLQMQPTGHWEPKQ